MRVFSLTKFAQKSLLDQEPFFQKRQILGGVLHLGIILSIQHQNMAVSDLKVVDRESFSVTLPEIDEIRQICYNLVCYVKINEESYRR